MRPIGLIAGMSWESPAEYYRLIDEEVRERLGDLHSAPCILHSLDFAEIEELQRSGAWEQAGTLLAQSAVALERACAGLIVLCPNTMRRVAAAIEQSGLRRVGRGRDSRASRQRFRSIIDALGARGAEGVILGCTEIGLLIRPGDVEMRTFDTTRLHTKAAVSLALEIS